MNKKESEDSAGTGAWEKVKLARHEQRPYTLDYIERLFENFVELHGDRKFADDPAIVAGMAFYHSRPIVIVGQQKGRDLKQRLHRNFGQANPEGYRKALRIMRFAEKFDRPVITFIDTPGAYPGLGAEERGIAEAIAYNLREMSKVRVPILAVVIGEGGSGGALGISIADYILMLENAIYSVISPESCSAILWRDQLHAEVAAEQLKLTAKDLHKLGVIDEIVPEPPGGAHTDPDAMAKILDERLAACLARLSAMPAEQRLQQRYEKFRKIGYFEERLQAQK
jgi:acetyl-CoA carboxylase carboxyl transferase subunit alpha